MRTALVAIFILVASRRAVAQERRDVSGGWPSDWRRVEAAEGAGIAIVLAARFLLPVALRAPESPRWDKPILFDRAVSDALRASSPQARANANTLSDFGYIGLPAFAIAVDAGLSVWLARGQADAALQLAAVDLEAVAITGFLTTLLQQTTARARPFVARCTTDPKDCGSADARNTAFLSGHTSIAFTAATSLCVQYAALSIYGSADPVVCPVALTVAGVTGVLRMVGDKHWATDVIAGAALGSAVGALVSLSHLRPRGAGGGRVSVGPDGRSILYGGPF